MSAGKRRTCLGALALATAFLPAGLAAQDKAGADPLGSLRACRAIASEADRLTCFDKAAAALVDAADEGDLSVVSNGIEITTAEGAVWLIPSPPRRLMTPRAGQSVEFRRGTLTSYFIRIDRQGGVKGRRIG